MRQQIVRRSVDPSRLHCRFDEFSENTPLNRLFKATLLRITSFVRSEPLRRRIANLTGRFGEIPSSPAPLRERIVWNRMNERFRQSHMLARMLLEAEWQNTSSGHGTGISLLFPMNLNIDPDIEVVTSLVSWNFLIPLLCIAFLLLCSLKVFKTRFIFFFLCWFFIILSPSSSIVTLHDLAAEHRIYLASAGIFILFAFGVSQVVCKCGETQPLKISSTLIFFVFVGALGIMTMKRNAVWQSELSLWQDTYQKSPQKLRPLINLARAHSMEGDSDKAIKYYQESLVKGPGVFATNYNLGDLYLKKGLVTEAIRHFQLASRIKPEIPESFAKLGEIYLSQNNFKLADSYFKRAVELNPQFAQVFKNLGVVNFYHLNQPKQGLAYFTRSLTLDPDQPEADKIRELLAQSKPG